MANQENKIPLSFDKYTECIVAMQKLKDIRAITSQWKLSNETDYQDRVIINDEDAMAAIFAIVQYNC